MTFLGSGHDTRATGAAWTLHLLANLAGVDVDHLPFLDNVCRESLRINPTHTLDLSLAHL